MPSETSPKTVLVTGSSSGMGRETALYLARRGYRVYAATRRPERLLGVADDRLIPLKMEITDPDSVQKAFAQIDRLDVLVNNAGYGLVSAVECLDESQMFEQFNTNVFGLLRVTAIAIPKMRAHGGVIINISSFLGKIGLPLLTLYNASKYAVEGITDSLRYELAPFGIRVHSVLPGFFDTDFARENLVVNKATFRPDSPYRPHFCETLAPRIIDEINHGNEPMEVARLIERIITEEHFPARVTCGEKSEKFIPMRRELSDEEFERRIRAEYDLPPSGA